MNKFYFIPFFFILLISCSEEVEIKDAVEEPIFIRVEEPDLNYSIQYFKSIDEFSLQGENELHIDSVTYPYIKRKQNPETFWTYTYVFSHLEKESFNVTWDEYNECYYELPSHPPNENTKWIEQKEEFYLDSFKLTIFSVNDVSHSDHFIEYFTVATEFEVTTYVPIHERNNYYKLDIRNVNDFIEKNDFAFITTINYEIIDGLLYSDYERTDSFDEEKEKHSSCYKLNNHSIFWWRNFTSSFYKC